MQHTILFAEDDDELREAICDQLVEAGYKVTTAGDGLQALDRLDGTAFDLALLDIRMPGKDGLHVLRQIKSRTPATRVIMVTGVDDFTVAIESVKLGANDYITKPFRLEDLLTRIEKFLTR
ncbi:MAG: response regulator [Bacteroidota bacterium]